MATPEQCPHYKLCGLVKLRTNQPSEQMEPLPKSGDCGINMDTCSRIRYLNEQNPQLRDRMRQATRVENLYTHEGAINNDELRALFPLKDNKHGRPKRRLIGGGNR